MCTCLRDERIGLLVDGFCVVIIGNIQQLVLVGRWRVCKGKGWGSLARSVRSCSVVVCYVGHGNGGGGELTAARSASLSFSSFSSSSVVVVGTWVVVVVKLLVGQPTPPRRRRTCRWRGQKEKEG